MVGRQNNVLPTRICSGGIYQFTPWELYFFILWKYFTPFQWLSKQWHHCLGIFIWLWAQKTWFHPCMAYMVVNDLSSSEQSKLAFTTQWTKKVSWIITLLMGSYTIFFHTLEAPITLWQVVMHQHVIVILMVVDKSRRFPPGHRRDIFSYSWFEIRESCRNHMLSSSHLLPPFILILSAVFWLTYKLEPTSHKSFWAILDGSPTAVGGTVGLHITTLSCFTIICHSDFQVEAWQEPQR